jgi:hypothetical protein
MVDKDRIKCDLCGKSFYSRKQLEQHKQDAHSSVNENIKIKTHKTSFKPSNKLITIIAVGVLVAIIGGIGIYSATAPHAPFALTIDGIECNAFEQLLFHIHAHLDIIINGQYFLVPAQIGIIPDKCFYWLHTHDVTGIIHIESPINSDFTIGQFFDIWNKKFNNEQIKFNNNQIFNYIANGNNPLSVYVNGTKVPNGANYRDIKLHAHDEIAIVYGTHPSSIPSSYNFPEGL